MYIIFNHITMSKKLYLAIDIEKSGDRFIDKILMIGCCLGDLNGIVIETKAFCGVVPSLSEFDKKCYDEFWIKHLDVLERIKTNSQPNMIVNFMDYYYDLEKRFPDSKIKLVSDNPAYDLSNIDVQLMNHGYVYPIRYSKNGGYRGVSDPSEMLNALSLSIQSTINKTVDDQITHDHWAENDAKSIYLTLIEIFKFTK